MKRRFKRNLKSITALTLIFICTFLLIPISASAFDSDLNIALEDEVKQEPKKDDKNKGENSKQNQSKTEEKSKDKGSSSESNKSSSKPEKTNENSNAESNEIEARSALLMEPCTGKIIYEKNADEKFAPASVTKIMTMLLTIEAVDSGKIALDDKVTCSENAKKMGGSTMLLDTGEIRTVEELLKGVAIASGNDAAVALAEYLGGTENDFVGMMNKRAEELGMTNTTFKNCNGLPADGHLSTANDIAKMSKELLKHPTILKYTGTYMDTITEGRKSPIELVNHNKLVRFFDGCDGLKTGFTNEAKYCISATATRNGVRMLSVIMGAPTYKIRNRDASILLNYGFSKYEGKKIFSKDEEVDKVYMDEQTDRYFMAKAQDDLTAVLPKGCKDEVEKKVVIDELQKEYKEGDVVGKCEIYLNNEKIGEVTIYCDRNIKKGNIFDNIKYNITHLFGDKEEGNEEKK
ncbi:D-alanyl-D-alanine carboxypeptidase family protein [Clostridium butyricum]|uniref:serine-type D-Ala-D-Ala carboxypeptidase n=1 Tax=Clostridium butyricum TaxID=1492 RepID=A0AAP9UDY2_CLOBU|nr:D-alanyl-D-alanine carboxypeptidase family protein [Clostridium butyricum]MBZ5746673.1 D-alanyl-D-alanine carboxypeptidase [Clostridium butyricum]MDU5723904.1 D-alanyl-D-alanine carboxypeptidase family protein [Clostridium butyricum]MDU5821787.1 D-alanyl-D-alanine carboxypeptidase family protein [Clostridium butyricum]QMW90717.1 D-alanyl-D-alanine carboxypeptidase [Clostridium butyricum]RQN11660.1 D-alanyl-D-alanine carboxypeptidase [Clostridium butyricum]